MKKIHIYFIQLILFKIIISTPNCLEGKNFCSKCNPVTNLCLKCEKDIYTPDDNGGCVYTRKCKEGNNHCLKCEEDEILCNTCEEAYYPDENGGCSSSDNCEISEDGNCIKCKDNYILIENNKMCKSLNSEDFKNCQNINIEIGNCIECKDGYYLSQDDSKCTTTENCSESIYGVCRKCIYGYYLDKRQEKCLKQEGVFEHCQESLNGKTCDTCEDDFFFDEEGLCCGTNYCSVKGEYYRCKKCINGYYLSIYGDCCTPDKNCYYGDKVLGICIECIDNYYFDNKEGKCKLQDNDNKYCKTVDGECTSCEYGYYLGKDNKCCNSQHCSESYLGRCEECEYKYFLGLDNKCINVEHCIYSKYEECTECENKYYYNKEKQNCIIAEGKFENCKYGNENGNCERCKNDFYLNKKDNLCYNNTEEGPLYKCAISDSRGETCIKCIDNYYIGYLDYKCTTIEGCDLSENENKCLECDKDYCLNLKDNRCYTNEYIIDESKKHYFNCNKTNYEGNKCSICKEGFALNENGLCIDEEHCSYKEKEICKRCSNDDGFYCLNNIFECVEIYHDHCLECNQLLDFENCTKCEPGYVLNDYSQCVEEHKN